MDETLENIPNIGPARRAALEAAGVFTRVKLGEISTEELVRITGMPRVTAEKTLDMVRADHREAVAGALAVPIPPPVLSPTAVPETVAPELPPLPKPEDGMEPVDARVQLERTILQVNAALSEVTQTRSVDGVAPRLHRQMEKFASLTERAGESGSRLKPKQIREIVRLFAAASRRMERFAAASGDGKAAQEELRASLRGQRKKIEELLDAARPRTRKKK